MRIIIVSQSGQDVMVSESESGTCSTCGGARGEVEVILEEKEEEIFDQLLETEEGQSLLNKIAQAGFELFSQ
ncbi:MAG: hypothetical protein A2729_02320 [Candidatus Buchananbacteria bacterium RIFCSPHIGHO2_01_FULL_39_14]|uniref:Uncharacterized protein n=1 Tax=Candidatus Buchananbacteria bacterium RIFCSPHIGHO2_01_FULL_39_14 TaxID=1797532 RepID=A0A1G1XY08_9BACT|nr:MAG: hypothetical protein A2729_02320 [Candidatus Buchananbacteria bacterium RIFCSPHIGHO2_01_FULL_39_14]